MDTETDKHWGRQYEEIQGECHVKAKEFQRPLINHWKPRKRDLEEVLPPTLRRCSLPPLEGTTPAGTLILDF